MTNDPLHFAGIRIDRYDLDGSIQTALKKLDSGLRLFFVNAHCVNVAQESPDYQEALSHAEMVLNDGSGISLAGKILEAPFPANLNGTDWIPHFLDTLNAEHEGMRVFLLGEKEEILVKVCDLFHQRWPHLEVVGMHQGFYDHPAEPFEAIWDAQPNLLIVGMGVPKQEIFIDQHWEALKNAGLRGALAGGAIFKFLVGEVQRAPMWLRNLHLEWLWRLCQEPQRLWRRYLIGNFTFLWLVVKAAIKGQRTKRR